MEDTKMWDFEIFKEIHEEFVEVIEILGRSSTGTVTFRDQKGRVHIKTHPAEVGDRFTVKIIHDVQPERSIYDDFMFE